MEGSCRHGCSQAHIASHIAVAIALLLVWSPLCTRCYSQLHHLIDPGEHLVRPTSQFDVGPKVNLPLGPPLGQPLEAWHLGCGLASPLFTLDCIRFDNCNHGYGLASPSVAQVCLSLVAGHLGYGLASPSIAHFCNWFDSGCNHGYGLAFPSVALFFI